MKSKILSLMCALAVFTLGTGIKADDCTPKCTKGNIGYSFVSCQTCKLENKAKNKVSGAVSNKPSSSNSSNSTSNTSSSSSSSKTSSSGSTKAILHQISTFAATQLCNDIGAKEAEGCKPLCVDNKKTLDNLSACLTAAKSNLHFKTKAALTLICAAAAQKLKNTSDKNLIHHIASTCCPTHQDEANTFLTNVKGGTCDDYQPVPPAPSDSE